MEYPWPRFLDPDTYETEVQDMEHILPVTDGERPAHMSASKMAAASTSEELTSAWQRLQRVVAPVRQQARQVFPQSGEVRGRNT
jgi:hypothetical protein